MQRRSLQVQMQQKKAWNNSGSYRIWTIDWYCLNFFQDFFFFFLLLHKLLLSPFCLILPLALDQAPWWDKKQKTGWKAQKKKISEPSEPSGWLRRERDGVLSLSLVPRLAHFVRLPIVFALLFTPFFCLFFPTKEPGPRLFFSLQF